MGPWDRAGTMGPAPRTRTRHPDPGLDLDPGPGPGSLQMAGRLVAHLDRERERWAMYKAIYAKPWIGQDRKY